MRLDHLLSKEMERKVDILYSVLSVITLRMYIENQIEAKIIYKNMISSVETENDKFKIHAR